MDARATALEGGLRGRFPASGMAVVVASLFGHVGGEGRVAGDPGVGGASAVTTPRSHLGGLY